MFLYVSYGSVFLFQVEDKKISEKSNEKDELYNAIRFAGHTFWHCPKKYAKKARPRQHTRCLGRWFA
jgi:hypothetical protein